MKFWVRFFFSPMHKRKTTAKRKDKFACWKHVRMNKYVCTFQRPHTKISRCHGMKSAHDADTVMLWDRDKNMQLGELHEATHEGCPASCVWIPRWRGHPLCQPARETSVKGSWVMMKLLHRKACLYMYAHQIIVATPKLRQVILSGSRAVFSKHWRCWRASHRQCARRCGAATRMLLCTHDSIIQNTKPSGKNRLTCQMLCKLEIPATKR